MRPRQPATRRRRRALLLAAAIVATVAGAIAGTRSTHHSRPGHPRVRAPQRLPQSGGARSRARPQAVAKPGRRSGAAGGRRALRRDVGQLLVFSFSGVKLPAYAGAILRERRAAGVILFAGNARSPGQLRALTRAIDHASGGSALVAADQEGGTVRTLPATGPRADQVAQGGAGAVSAAARSTARRLRSLGVNVDLAPVADVAHRRSVMRRRAFLGSATAVSARVAASVRGFLSGRVAPTLKHFPGFGAATRNTDREPVTIAISRAALDRDLAPFRAGIAAGAPVVMVSHARYPSIDPGRIASQSPLVIGGLLRGRLGFRGAVVTDSLEARAVTRRVTVATAALRSLRAGADLLLLTGPGSYRPVLNRLVAAARSSAALRARISQALVRVAELRRRLGLADPMVVG
ncbi:MAG TPA: glycoside hydrolase family 3 N-terminal domain-containing protein [Solirubrobacteraceae bacterium]|nr:glycoside hydrolase family 3 N-terminal domain-containing protein [Solirubrobacteraceae bacterium]